MALPQGDPVLAKQTARALSLIVLTFGLTSEILSQQPHAPHQPVAPLMAKRHSFDTPVLDQTVTGALWVGDSNFKSTIYMRNSLKTDPLIVTPVLHLGDGTHYALSPVLVAAESTVVVDLNQALLARNIVASAAISGYVELQYQWHWAALCAFVRNVDVVHSVIFTSPLNPSPTIALPNDPTTPPLHSIEGMWWKEGRDVTAFVALSNVTNHAINAQMSVDSHGAALAEHSLLLSPHTTSTVPLVDLPAQEGSTGGIRIRYDGVEGGLDVNGGLEDLQTGYSANLPFVPVAPPTSSPSAVESTVVQLSLMNGSQNSQMHLPAKTVFTPYSIARNLSDAPLTVTPEIWWMVDSVPKSAMLPPVTVPAHQTVSLNPAAMIQAARLYNFDGEFNFVLHTKGLPNALLLAGGSVDKTHNYVFSVAPHAVSESAAKTLSYWSTGNGDDTMLTLWNPADEAQDLILRLTFTGGHYLLPVDLGAGATRSLDLAQIIRSQTPDAEGNVIPAGIHDGGMEVHGSQGEQEQILIAVDAGIYNAQKATCYQGCNSCSGYTGASVFPASSPLFPPGVTSDQLTFMIQFSSGNQINQTSQSTWSSSNTAVATVTSGLAHAVAGGSASIFAYSTTSYPVYVQICNAYFPGCPIGFGPPEGSEPATVQIPIASRIVSTIANHAQIGCLPGQAGWYRQVLKIVTDQTGADIVMAGQSLAENVTVTSPNQLNLGGSLVGSAITNTDGTFTDSLYFCSKSCPGTAQTNATQTTTDTISGQSPYTLQPNSFVYSCTANTINGK
jgi:hypothetical protein